MAEPLTVLYVIGAIVTLVLATLVAWIDGEHDHRSRVLGARVALFAWAWPVMAVGAVLLGLRSLWAAAEWATTDTEGQD